MITPHLTAYWKTISSPFLRSLSKINTLPVIQGTWCHWHCKPFPWKDSYIRNKFKLAWHFLFSHGFKYERKEEKDGMKSNEAEELDLVFKASSSYLVHHLIGNIYVWFLFKRYCQRVQIYPKSTPHITYLKKDFVNTWQRQQKYRHDIYIVH